LKDEVQEVKEEVPEEGGEPKDEAPVRINLRKLSKHFVKTHSSESLKS